MKQVILETAGVTLVVAEPDVSGDLGMHDVHPRSPGPEITPIALSRSITASSLVAVLSPLPSRAPQMMANGLSRTRLPSLSRSTPWRTSSKPFRSYNSGSGVLAGAPVPGPERAAARRSPCALFPTRTGCPSGVGETRGGATCARHEREELDIAGVPASRRTKAVTTWNAFLNNAVSRPSGPSEASFPSCLGCSGAPTPPRVRPAR